MHFESLAYYLRNVNLVLFGLLGQLHQEGKKRSVFFEGIVQCAVRQPRRPARPLSQPRALPQRVPCKCRRAAR